MKWKKQMSIFHCFLIIFTYDMVVWWCDGVMAHPHCQSSDTIAINALPLRLLPSLATIGSLLHTVSSHSVVTTEIYFSPTICVEQTWNIKHPFIAFFRFDKAKTVLLLCFLLLLLLVSVYFSSAETKYSFGNKNKESSLPIAFTLASFFLQCLMHSNSLWWKYQVSEKLLVILRLLQCVVAMWSIQFDRVL